MTHWTDAAWNEAHEVVPVVVFREVTTPTAVIEHTCTVCRGTIRVGRPYRREVGMAAGDTAPTVTKEHLPDCYVEAEE